MNQSSIARIWLLVSLAFFVVSGSMGLILRWYGVHSISGVDYAFFRQGHSHVAFLGWGYLALIVLMIEQFLPKGSIQKPKYRWNLILTNIFIGGMVFSFPIWGYKVLSIALLSLFLVTSVVLVIHFLKDYVKEEKTGISHYFIIAAFVWYMLSGIGPFALGPVVVFYGKGDLYHLAVYYYLHFLYNGFFVFGIGALFFKYLESSEIQYSREHAKRFFWLLAIACLPAYALSTLWMDVADWVIGIAVISGFLQLFALFYLWKLLTGMDWNLRAWVKILLRGSLIAFSLKIIFQMLSAFPVIASLVYESKSFVVIGYIHLVTLGFISLFLLGWMVLRGEISMVNRSARLGVNTFLLGFVVTEFLLLLRGLFQWIEFTGFESFFLWLAIFSSLLPFGILLLLMGQFSDEKK